MYTVCECRVTGSSRLMVQMAGRKRLQSFLLVQNAPGNEKSSSIGRIQNQITDDPTAQPQPKPTSFVEGLTGVVQGNAASKVMTQINK